MTIDLKMKYGKLLFAVLSLPFLTTSCKKDSTAPIVKTSPIVGDWNFVSESDTLFYSPKITEQTFIANTNLYGSIKFQQDGTVYTTKSFIIGTAVNGGSIFFIAQILLPIITDTSKYTINGNVLTITNKSGSSSIDTIEAIDNHKLIFSNLVSSAYKKAWYYSK